MNLHLRWMNSKYLVPRTMPVSVPVMIPMLPTYLIVSFTISLDCYKLLKPPTLKDIAKRLNISISTVSRAIRNASDVNPETKK
jgi:AraC-like DNA-binding protein